MKTINQLQDAYNLAVIEYGQAHRDWQNPNHAENCARLKMRADAAQNELRDARGDIPQAKAFWSDALGAYTYDAGYQEAPALAPTYKAGQVYVDAAMNRIRVDSVRTDSEGEVYVSGTWHHSTGRWEHFRKAGGDFIAWVESSGSALQQPG